MRRGRYGVPRTGTCLVGESTVIPLTSPLTFKYLWMYLPPFTTSPHLTLPHHRQRRYAGRYVLYSRCLAKAASVHPRPHSQRDTDTEHLREETQAVVYVPSLAPSPAQPSFQRVLRACNPHYNPLDEHPLTPKLALAEGCRHGEPDKPEQHGQAVPGCHP